MTTRQPSETVRSSIRRPQRFPPQLQQPQQPQPQQQQQQHHLHHQYQQQQQQPQSTVHLQQPYQHQSFLFDAEFDLVGRLGAGFTAGSSAGNNSTNSNDHSTISNNNNNGGRGHSGGTNAKSSLVKSTPLTPAKPDRAESKFDPIASIPGHNMSSFFGASDDPLMASDADSQPFFADFGSTDRRKKSAPSTIGREPKKAVVTPLQTPQPQESTSLGMLDDIFQPTLGFSATPSRPIAKATLVRERQLPQHKQQQQQQQQQQQPPPPPPQRQTQTHQQLLQQQQHHDSSLDFFSSLDSISPTRSTSSSSRTSPSASFAHLGSIAPLPSFPSIPADYSAFGRNGTARKTTPVRKLSQSSNTPSSTTKDTGSPLETVSSLSSPLSALADVLVSNNGSEPRPSSFTGSRKKSDAALSMSASVTSSKSSASTLASSAVSSAGQAVSKTPSRSTSSSNMSSTASSPSESPSLAPSTAPSKPAPKMPARILNLPRHPTPTPLPTQNTSARIDSILAPQRPPQQPPQPSQPQQLSQPPPPSPPLQQQQNLEQQLQQAQALQDQQQSTYHSLPPELRPQEQQPTSRSSVSLSVPQPPPPPTGGSQHVSQQDTNPPYIPPPVQAPPQFPSSPWDDDDDDDFYQAPISPPPVVVPTVKAASRKVVEPGVQAPPKQVAPLKQTVAEPQQPQQQQQQQQQRPKQSKQDYQKQDHPKPKQPTHQPPQPHPQLQSQPKQEQQQAPAQTRKQVPKPLAPEHDKAMDAKHGDGTSSAPPLSPSAPSPDSLFMARYPPPPPSILYSDDQITVSSLHLTIHSFYFPLNTPVTIPLLTITELETLPTEGQNGGGNGGSSGGGGVASWLKYKNWGVSTALTDIWWARDYKPLGTAVTGARASSRLADKENTPPLVYVVVRVEGEWLRKGFGVQQEQGVKVLKDAWKNVKENERGLRPLRPATMGMEEDDDGLMIEKPAGGQSLSNQSGGRIASGGPNAGGDSGAEKRRWLSYQNTWTAYPFADDSPQFLAQQHRRGATSKAPRYHQQQSSLRPKPTGASGGHVYLGPEESCGDEPLFIDNDLNIHEEI